MSYLALKLLHIASVVVFLGNIFTGLYWAGHAHKSRNFARIASTFDGIIRSDRLFTVPGVIAIVVTGVVSAIIAGFPILGTGWILWSIVLFSISGVVFGVWVAPLQREILEASRAADSTDVAWDGYVESFRKWEFWGLIALAAPIAAMAIMVLKPALPGL